MGASISSGSGGGSGTLGCYVTNPDLEGAAGHIKYAITNAHVVQHDNSTTFGPHHTAFQEV